MVYRNVQCRNHFSRRSVSLQYAIFILQIDLKMNDCDINADRISFRSLKHFSITCCHSVCRVRVSAPGLVSLKLGGFIGMTPFLEGMALLEAACANLGNKCKDVCLNHDWCFLWRQWR